MIEFTYVYVPEGTVHHVLDPGASPNSSYPALCGRTPWPGMWHGTGSQTEYDHAGSLRPCVGCVNALKHRTGRN